MPSYKKTKGNKFEKEVLGKLRSNNIISQRVVASGSVKEDSGDIVMIYEDTPYNIECKFHKEIPTKILDDWLSENDILIMRQNRGIPMVYMPMDILLALIVSKRRSK